MNNKSKHFKNILILLIVLMTALNCKKTPDKSENITDEPPVIELTGIVTFLIGDCLINGKTASLRDEVFADDVVAVKKNSAMVIQFASSALLTIKSNTKIRVSELVNIDNKPVIGLYQESGSTFNKIIRGKADYKIKTPTTVASVRGTSFTVLVGEKKSSIRLLRGEVKVTRPEEPDKEIILNDNQKIDADIKGLDEVKPLDEKEQEDLAEMDKIEILPGETLENPVPDSETKIVPESAEKILLQEEQIKKEDGITISELKKKFGKLSRIRTKGGKEYIGAFKQTGNRMEITSTKGRLTLPVSEIEKVSPYE